MNNKNLGNLRVDYASEGLARTSLANDPFTQFALWFEDVLATPEKEDANAMVLSTVRDDRQPSARIVLLKEIDERGLIFFTNFESRKGKELATNPKCSVTFWWRSLHRQVRVEGEVDKISEERSKEYFKSRPRGSQMGAIVSPQSREIKNRQFLLDRLQRLEDESSDLEILPKPEHWGGYIIVPHVFEFWQGQENRLHDRFQYVKTSHGWEIKRLAP